MRLSELAVDVMPLTRAFRLKSLQHDAALAAFREVQRSALKVTAKSVHSRSCALSLVSSSVPCMGMSNVGRAQR